MQWADDRELTGDGKEGNQIRYVSRTPAHCGGGHKRRASQRTFVRRAHTSKQEAFDGEVCKLQPSSYDVRAH